MTRRVCLFCMVLALITTAFAAGQAPKMPNATVEVKAMAPDFSVTSIKGEKLELVALRGKVVVLNFWFIGCQPCAEEMPKLNDLVDKFGKKGVVFIAPTLDDVINLGAFLKEHPFKYYVVPNAGDLILKSYRNGSPQIAFPRHLVIDKDGKIDTDVSGASEVDEVRKAIVRLVNNPARKEK
jgi:peroxiredoxin